MPDAESIVIVNIPAFQLYAWTAADRGKKATLTMPVVVGKAARTRTPVLAAEISYLVFPPYWYVPRSIVVKEMLPAYKKDPEYFDKKDLELTATSDDSKPGLPATPENVEKLRAGSLGVRQKPGPRNALGRVKFIFPNGDSVYLHDTPAKSFFERERRDFSHGCVRVSDPPALAAFLLRNTSAGSRRDRGGDGRGATEGGLPEAEGPGLAHLHDGPREHGRHARVLGGRLQERRAWGRTGQRGALTARSAHGFIVPAEGG